MSAPENFVRSGDQLLVERMYKQSGYYWNHCPLKILFLNGYARIHTISRCIEQTTIEFGDIFITELPFLSLFLKIELCIVIYKTHHYDQLYLHLISQR